MASQASSTSKPCTFFLRGRCSRGSDCHYSHATPSRQTRGTPATPKPFFAMQTCKFFQRGSCTNSNCPFVHEFVESHQKTVVPTPAPELSQVPANHCRFHLQGGCQNGDTCRFYHAPGQSNLETSLSTVPTKHTHKVAIWNTHSRPSVKSGSIVRSAAIHCYIITQEGFSQQTVSPPLFRRHPRMPMWGQRVWTSQQLEQYMHAR